jgi:hypothetical protein
LEGARLFISRMMKLDHRNNHGMSQVPVKAKCYSSFLSGLTSYVGEIIVDYHCRFDIRNKLNGNSAFIKYWRTNKVQLDSKSLIYNTCGKPMIWPGEKHCATFLLFL